MEITVQITPDEKVPEMTSEETDEQKRERIYSGAALNAPAHWGTSNTTSTRPCSTHLTTIRTI